jgi:hypothetical protein
VADGIKTGVTASDDFLAAAEELHNSLLDRLLHYQRVIRQAGFNIPYGVPVDDAFVTLGQSADDEV